MPAAPHRSARTALRSFISLPPFVWAMRAGIAHPVRLVMISCSVSVPDDGSAGAVLAAIGPERVDSCVGDTFAAGGDRAHLTCSPRAREEQGAGEPTQAHRASQGDEPAGGEGHRYSGEP